MYQTNMYEGMLAETTTMHGHNGDAINAYFARPLGSGPFPGVVLIHHLPGWDEWYREAARRFAHHGFAAISPNLYHREGHGDPEDVGARVWADGGVPDDQAVGDIVGAMKYLRALPYLNRKVGVFGTCSGGRHVMLTVGRESGFDAGVDCWGGGVVMSKEQLNDKNPVAPIDYTANVSCPILGLFGEEDQSPTPGAGRYPRSRVEKARQGLRVPQVSQRGPRLLLLPPPRLPRRARRRRLGQDLGLLREAPQLAFMPTRSRVQSRWRETCAP